MIVLKILAAPVMVALSLLAAMVTFLFCVASAVCELGCIVLTLLSLILFIGGQTVGGKDFENDHSSYLHQKIGLVSPSTHIIPLGK